MFMTIRYWNQLRKAFLQSEMKWPMHSQKDINDAYRANPLEAYKLTWTDIKQTVGIILFQQPSNPTILRPLQALRYTLAIFLMIPIFLAVFMILFIFASSH